jgi:hypothetical protein
MKIFAHIALILSLISDLAAASPMNLRFDSTEIPGLVKRVLYVRIFNPDANALDGEFCATDFKLNPSTGEIEKIPLKITDNTIYGDCFIDSTELKGEKEISKIECDYDGYSDGGSTGFIAVRDEASRKFHITGYVKNQPEEIGNWSVDLGTQFEVTRFSDGFPSCQRLAVEK